MASPAGAACRRACAAAATSTGGNSSRGVSRVMTFLLLLLLLARRASMAVRGGASCWWSQLVLGIGPPYGTAHTPSTSLNFTRRDFPSDFVFGAGTSAYQYEGAAAEDGRTPSIWDTFTHAGKMPDKSTGDRAADGYHKYKEDVKLMSDTALEAYRFSISWSRLIPRGKGPVNPKGLEYYNNLINELVKRGIEIHVTLYHLDFPQDLEDEYHGWLSPRGGFHGVRGRGDRVTHWTTLDEPNVLPIAAYDNGLFPPNRCSPPFGTNCTAGNSAVEPYVVAHHSILAHASATQKGVVGINIYSFWEYPFSSSSADIAAAQRALDFSIGWILNPLVYGDYPEIMKKKAGSRIPSFTKEQSELIRGGTDFVGINHYSSAYISDGSNDETTGPRDYNADVATIFRFKEWCTDRSGFGQFFNDSVNDPERVEYLSAYIASTLAALRNGANVKGYFVWAFIDLFELLTGHNTRYGLHYVDFDDPMLPRQPKLSAQWYSKFLRNEIVINTDKIVSPDAHERADQ
ncbi:hypothetical protein GUJ93_ZPchr0005g14805 [Zizania palustris]|uniref:Beta-glucosidase n=1 Tax=Zizania palustris TaxID=103762 RepID=A0A8J5VE60_ZIZPA|nr:hypothetical protein GUJ93_ZPchr0005g14805 [Zizania palustris]